MKIAVWFSNGVPSACALKLAVEKYGADQVVAVNNPVAEEHADNLRFQRDVAEWCGVPIQSVMHKDYPLASAVDVWDRRKAMAFPKGAPCTTHLKIQARQQWEKDNPVDWHVLGFTLEEKRRHENFVLTERDNVLPLLIDANMMRADCADMVRGAGIALPHIYDLGYPNANCIGCVKATTPTYWNLVRKTFPDIFAERAAQSRRLGARLVRVKGVRIFLDELKETDKGRPLKKMPDCGLFCEEPIASFRNRPASESDAFGRSDSVP
jgi:hypothetical protein